MWRSCRSPVEVLHKSSRGSAEVLETSSYIYAYFKRDLKRLYNEDQRAIKIPTWRLMALQTFVAFIRHIKVITKCWRVHQQSYTTAGTTKVIIYKSRGELFLLVQPTIFIFGPAQSCSFKKLKVYKYCKVSFRSTLYHLQTVYEGEI